MKNKIIELRAILPIPMLEAKQLLEQNNYDVETCVYLYKAKAIKEITKATGCDSKQAEYHYQKERFDINRAISMINDEIYDQNYEPIKGVNHENLQFVKDWLYAMESKDFAYSLSYKHLQNAIDTMLLIPKLKEIGNLLQKAKNIYSYIFDNYNDNKPLEEFVRLNQRLDNEPDFQIANSQIPLQIFFIKDEISRHWRNL